MNLSFKPYRRRLKVPIKMSRGIIEYREGVILRLESEKLAFGEVVILDYFGTESLSRSLEALTALPRNVALETLTLIPDDCFATRLALESALIVGEVKREMEVSKLLPAGLAAIEELKIGLAQDYQTFKWKIGSYQNEFEIFEELTSIGSEVKFRLDANGGLSLEQARNWLKISENAPVEFIEQPLAPELFQETLALAKEFPTPIALDESVAKYEDIVSADLKGWSGIYVVKPSRLGKLREFFDWREKSRAKIVYSSALETSFGTEMGMRVAASDLNNNFALGYGVSHFFKEDGLNIHQEDSKVIAGNVDSTKLEMLWQEL